MSEWRKMAIAPLDGTSVLLLWEDHTISVGRWVNSERYQYGKLVSALRFWTTPGMPGFWGQIDPVRWQPLPKVDFDE